VQSILIVGEGETAELMAQELYAAGYRVDLRAFAAASDASDATAVIVVGGELDGLASLGGSGDDRRPVLALLPEEALDSGPIDLAVDDYAFLPLRPHELEMRLRRLVDRRGLPDSPDVLHRGALAIDAAGYKVYVDGAHVELTFKEYELLRFLALHPNRVYRREALLDKVWGYDYFGGARTVDVHIRRIRSKIERNHVFIETVRSVGYRFRASP